MLNFQTIFRWRIAPAQRALALVLLAATILMSVVAYQSMTRYTLFVEHPIGCDDFGYLRQARLFRQAGPLKALDTEVKDDLTVSLVRALKASSLPVGQWQELVAPHCHHYKPSVDKVVLQYPPGTGLFLSVFPEGKQSRYATRTATLLMLAGLLAALVYARTIVVAVLVLYLAVVCFTTASTFSLSMSIAPSLVLVVALAYLLAAKLDFTDLETQWRWHAAAGLVLGLATGARIPNLFLVAGFLACYGLAWLWRPSLRGLAAPAAFGIALIVGTLPVLLANAINAGSPFSTTYSAYDAANPVLDWSMFKTGAHYFFVEHPETARTVALGLLPVAALAVVLFRTFDARYAMVLLAAAVNLVTNLGYFILHDGRAPYYLAPLAVFAAACTVFALIGMAQRRAEAAVAKEALWLRAIAAAVCFAGVCVATSLPRLPVFPMFRDANLHRAFDSRTVVWSDFKSGYFHYFQGRQASKLTSANAGVQDQVIGIVGASGVTQVAVSDSPRMATLIARLRAEGRAAPAGQAYGDDVFIVCPMRMTGSGCPPKPPS